jgi:hypothetical protein
MAPWYEKLELHVLYKLLHICIQVAIMKYVISFLNLIMNIFLRQTSF